MPLLQVAGSRHNLLVTAATGQMMVYNADRLVWAAKGDTCPVAVKVATFAGLPGRSISPHYHLHHTSHIGSLHTADQVHTSTPCSCKAHASSVQASCMLAISNAANGSSLLQDHSLDKAM